MAEQQKHARLPGKLVFVGFGSVGQGVLPLLLRHLEIRENGGLRCVLHAFKRAVDKLGVTGAPKA